MILPKSPYLWLSISVTCCAFALGYIPSVSSSDWLAEDTETTLTQTVEPAAEVLYYSDLQEPQPITHASAVVELQDNVYAGEDILLDGPYDRDVFKVVEQMPLFPGQQCGDIDKYKKRKKCANKALLEFIYNNIKYPKKARDRGVQGMAVVSFIVEPHGAITTVEIARDPGAGLGKAVEKVVKKMVKDGLRWEPGLQKGKPVPVQFMLPVNFKLE